MLCICIVAAASKRHEEIYEKIMKSVNEYVPSVAFKYPDIHGIEWSIYVETEFVGWDCGNVERTI